MPRSKLSVLTPPPAAEPGSPAPPPAVAPAVRSIPDDAVFRLDELQAVLRLPKHTLKREARLGRLRVSKRAGRLWTTGRWVMEWLTGNEVRRRKVTTEPEQAIA